MVHCKQLFYSIIHFYFPLFQGGKAEEGTVTDANGSYVIKVVSSFCFVFFLTFLFRSSLIAEKENKENKENKHQVSF